MPVTYDSYLAKVVEAGITMLAASATFRTLVGAADSAAAKTRIVESWGGAPAQAGGAAKAKAVDGTSFTAAPPFGHVHSPGMQQELAGVGFYIYRGDVMIGLVQVRKLTGETPAEQFRRARNIADGVRADLTAMFGTTGCFAQGTIDIDGPELPDETGADGDALVATLILSWEA